ncbi:MAG: hypothetical protein EAZ74_00005, partial [Alphaproteobacteria bacterium]
AKIPNSKYLWSDKSTNQTLRVTKSGVYKVSVSTPTCADILTDSVKVNFITLDLGKDTVITCDKTITLDTKIANAQYKWSDGSTAQTLRVSKSGKYKVSVTLPNCSRMLTDSVLVVLPELNIGNGRDSMRVCTSELTLDAFNNAPNTDFTWSGGSKNQTLKVNKDGWYKVTVNRRDCNIILVDSIYVSFFKVNLGKDIVTCQNEITLNAGNSGARYLWNDAKKSTTRTLKVTDSGTYLVTVTDTCGAVAQSSIIVVFNRLKSNITGDTLFACQKPYVLDAGNKGVAASYLWNDGTKNQTLSIDKDGLYSVAMTDSCKNQLTNRIFVTFAKPTLNFPDTMRTCTDSLILNPRIRQGVFTWSDGSSLPRLRVSQAGKYWVSIRTACGDILRDTVQAIFNRVPKADFNFQISATQGGSVIFNNTSTGEDTDEYLWEFGDGKISRERNPIYIFQQVGNFNQAAPGVLVVGVSSSLVRADSVSLSEGGSASEPLGPVQGGVSLPFFTSAAKAGNQAQPSVVNVTGNLNLGGTVNAIVSRDSLFRNGDGDTIFTYTGTGAVTAAVTTNIPSNFIRFSLVNNSTSKTVKLSASRSGYETAATNANAAAAATAFGGSVNGVVDRILADANGQGNFGSVAELAQAQDMANLISALDWRLTMAQAGQLFDELSSAEIYGSLAAVDQNLVFGQALDRLALQR